MGNRYEIPHMTFADLYGFRVIDPRRADEVERDLARAREELAQNAVMVWYAMGKGIAQLWLRAAFDEQSSDEYRRLRQLAASRPPALVVKRDA